MPTWALLGLGLFGCGGRSQFVSGEAGRDASVASSAGSQASDGLDGGGDDEDAAINFATACLGGTNVFSLGSDTSDIQRAPYVVNGGNILVEVTSRVFGMPSDVRIMDADDGWELEFATGSTSQALVAASYSVSNFAGDGTGPSMTIAAQGIGGAATGSFQVIAINAVPVSAPMSDGPEGLTSFTAMFDEPAEARAGCVHVQLSP